MLVDFKNSFTEWLISKAAESWLLNIPAHLKPVATLPCEILMLKIAMLKNWMKKAAVQDSATIIEQETH